MSQFFQRIANYVGNEIIVKGLANSKSFQKFAVRSSKRYETMQKQSAEHLNKTMDELMNEAAAEASATTKAKTALNAPPKPPLRGVAGFLSAFAKEAKSDFSVRERW
uniref:Uncharacterized protein n=1 Tax=Craspedostauros australis TaxID=1486917 RepID=A0A7S0F507_9STRA|mmetsp:Transcript_615/g.1739  ORF Transcript_615/g.1739 Transcript_615/m.1739 type:complete len:107 (+) Transcript_615:160-480(+)